jgi:20S proteasome alpha/beta subunit
MIVVIPAHIPTHTHTHTHSLTHRSNDKVCLASSGMQADAVALRKNLNYMNTTYKYVSPSVCVCVCVYVM